MQRVVISLIDLKFLKLEQFELFEFLLFVTVLCPWNLVMKPLFYSWLAFDSEIIYIADVQR